MQASLDGLVDEFRNVGSPVHEFYTPAPEADTLGFRVAPGAGVFVVSVRRIWKVREAARAAMRGHTPHT